MRETSRRNLRINRLLRPLGVALAELDEAPYWPRHRARQVDRSFLFLLAPPNAGSTEIARYMARRGDIGALHPSFEGQRLVKGLMDSDRWWPEKFVDYEAVIGGWSARIAQLDPEGRHRHWLEKSPPNLVRHARLFSHFPDHRAVICNRAPLATIGSQLRRFLFKEYHGARRALVVRHLAQTWQWRSRLLMEAARRHGYPCISYERFCERPDTALDAFALEPLLPVEPGLPQRPSLVAREVLDLNREEVQILTEHEREMALEELSPAGEVLDFFGYDPNAELAASQAEDAPTQ